MSPLKLFFNRWTFILVAGFCLSLVAPVVAAPSNEEVAVVVHPGVTEDNLSLAQVRRILLGDRQFWSSDLRVTLLIPAPQAPEREVLLKTIYHMSEAQFRHYWIAKVFRGEVPVGPKIIFSNRMAMELVGRIPGSIGFMDASQVPKELKVLTIDGHLPGEEGYRLR